jgi:inosine-uridine nucleoside N-ribohydrolase
MVAAIDPACVTQKESKYVEVELGGVHTRGQTCIDWYNVSKRKPNVDIVHAIRIERLEELLVAAISYQ